MSRSGVALCIVCDATGTEGRRVDFPSVGLGLVFPDELRMLLFLNAGIIPIPGGEDATGSGLAVEGGRR